MNLNKKQGLIYVCPKCDRRIRIIFEGYTASEIIKLKIICKDCRVPLLTLLDYLWG